MKIETIKEEFLDRTDKWLKRCIEEMLRDNPSLVIPSVYIKRGCHNILKKYEGQIEEGIDKAALFIADENGEVNINTLFTDMMEIFKSMEETEFDTGILRGVIGKGKISIELPENLFTNIIFGSKKAVTLNENDLLELKTLLLAEQ